VANEHSHHLGPMWIGRWALLLLASCGGPKSDGVRSAPAAVATAPAVPASAIAKATLSVLRERSGRPLPEGLAEAFERVPDGLRPRFPTSMAPSARVRIPGASLAAVQLDDVGSGAGVDVALEGALIVDAEAADGYVVYPKAHVSGATLLHRALPDGLEDYLSFDKTPAGAAVSYKLSLRKGVSGLRLVAGTLELLDAKGAPRLRVAPPYVVGADGVQTDARLAVEGCRVDTDAAAPWGRRPTSPGATSCTVRVSWDDDEVVYPALLDPRWTTTATSMVAARTDHTMTTLANGQILVVGGRASTTSTTGLNTAELFNPAGGGTWAATTPMSGVRFSHSATLLPTSSNTSTSGRVLIAGGVTGTATVNTSQLWNPATGQWGTGPNLNAARHGHTATLMPNGNVLVAGGMSLANGTTTVLNTAAIYTNPTTGTSTGSWAATGNMGPARRFHTATLLTTNSQNNTSFNNMVLVVGGNTGGTTSTTSVQLFNTSTSMWSNTTALAAALEGQTATRLANGNVLITGGRTNNGAPVNTTAVFTIPVTGTSASWPSGGNMQAARIAHTATLLGTTLATTGSVLVAGGSTNGTAAINTAELWNGSAWSLIATNMPAAVQAHTAALLGNGTVLVAGGNSGTNAVNTARIFDPSLGVGCTASNQCLSGFCVIPSGQSSGVCCDTACTNACMACNLSGSVGTCSARPNGTTCNDSNACTNGDSCQAGNCSGGPAVTCPGADQCHSVAACVPSSGCPTPVQFPDGTACNDNNASTEIDACRGGLCIGAADPAVVIGFEALGRWSIGQGATASIVGLNSNHTQGSKSLEVTGQNYIPINSVKMTSPGSVAPIALLDILLPIQQGNPNWFGSVQLFVSAPSIGINNAFLGQAELTGLQLATWQTLGFQLTADQVTRLSGSYSDLTFTIALNVPFNETGHYLFDNLRFAPAVQPVLLGVAQNTAGVLKAVFGYQTAETTSIPYGPANALLDDTGFLSNPPDYPPEVFLPNDHTPFSTRLAGNQLTWRIGAATATATPSSTPLQTQPGPNGTRVAILPDGSLLNLDTDSDGPIIDDTVVASDTSYTNADNIYDINNGAEFPIGPTSAGTLPGSFKVTDDGAAAYNLPLELPGGRNGVQPSLTLSYNSRGGNGFLGPGWTLQGLHRISRCKRPYGLALDKGLDPSAITYTSTDELCLDNEPLVAVGTDEYRMKRDQQSKIVVTTKNNDGPLSFTVYLKNGQIQYYGTDDSTRSVRHRVTHIGDTSADAVLVATDWYLAKTVDRFGNTMTNTYQFETVFVEPGILASGPAYPKTIEYTSNPITGRAATNKISFSYVPDPFIVVKWAGGVAGRGASILSSIDITAPNPVTPSLVTTYKLTYLTPEVTGPAHISRRALLRRVQRCDGKGVCMAPTIFGWSLGSYAVRHVPTDISDFFCPTSICPQIDDCSHDAQVFSRTMISADVNGDGREDLLYRPNIQNGYCTQSPRPSTAFRVRLGGPGGLGPAIETGLPDITNEEFNHKAYPPVAVLDIDGDGKTDIFALQEGEFFGDQGRPVSMFWSLFRSTGSGGFSRQPPGLTDAQFFDEAFNPEVGGITNSFGRFFPADINGDGLTDVARSYFKGTEESDECNGRLKIRMNANGSLGPYETMPFAATWITGPPGLRDCQAHPKPRGLFIGDIDGDGRTEIVMSGDPNPSYGVRRGMAGFGTISTNIPKEPAEYRTIDVNGDGLPDVLRQSVFPSSDRSLKLWINTGNGFYTQRTVPDDETPLRSLFNDVFPGFIDDINGDGIDDVFVPGCGTSAGPAKAYIGDGTGSFQAITLDVPRAYTQVERGGFHAQTCMATYMDVDGDGQKDVVQGEEGSNTLHIYFRDKMRPDRIQTVDNGLRDHVGIEYGRHAPVEACQYPNLCRGRNVEVVTGYTINEGQIAPGDDPTTHYSMTYSGPKVDALGGGWLGFASVEVHNDRTHVRSRRLFDLDRHIGSWRPLAGHPTFESTSYALSGTNRIITRQRTTIYTVQATNPADPNGPYVVVPGTVDDREIEQAPGQGFDPSSPQRWMVQNNTYDSVGNLKRRETQGIRLGSLDVVEYGITNDVGRWLIGKINSVTATSTFNGDSDQRVTTFQIDPATGAIMSRTVQPGDPKLELTSVYLRNKDGLVYDITETPVQGTTREVRIAFDEVAGTWPAKIRNPLGHTTRMTYHPGLGVLASVIDPNHVRTRWQVDGFGRTRARFDGQGATVQFHFDRPNATSKGLIKSWTNSVGRSGSEITDTLDREIRRTETAFDGVHTVTSTRYYDPRSGLPHFISRPFGATGGTADAGRGTTFEYDEMARLLSFAPRGAATKTMSYAGFRQTEFLDGVRKAYRVEDGAGHLTTSAVVEPTSSAPNGEIVTTYDYGAFGRLRQAHLPGGSVAGMDYDHLGHNTGITDPDAGRRTTDYDAFGDVVGETFPGQAALTYIRDRLGRIELLTSGDGTTTNHWDRGGVLGKLGSTTSPFGVTTTYEYQPNELLSASTWTVDGSPFRFDWSYDSSGRLQTIKYPDIGAGSRFEVSVGYGLDGRQASVQVPGTSPFWQKASVQDDGQIFTEAFSNALSSLYDSDADTGRLKHISTGFGAVVDAADGTGRTLQNALQSLGYAYYPDGKVQKRTDEPLAAVETFSYDNADRLTDWNVASTQTAVHFGYDDTGNLRTRNAVAPSATTTETYGYGENGAGPHAVTSGPLGSYGYDSSGRQKSRPGVASITSTAFDLPKHIDGSTPVDFKYDSAGRRVLKQSASSTTITVGSLYERRTQGGTVTHVFYLPGDGRVVGQLSCSSQAICNSPMFFHPDRLGTVDTVTQQSLVGRQKRDPFGRAYAPGSLTEPGPIVSVGFAGLAEDDETGLINMNHRLYDATAGRFITPDPFVKDRYSGQDYNRYSYARNNPLSFVDVTGLLATGIDLHGLPGQEYLGAADVGIVLEGDAEFDDGYFNTRPASEAQYVGEHITFNDDGTYSTWYPELHETVVHNPKPAAPDPTALPSTFARVANTFFAVERWSMDLIPGPMGEWGKMGINLLHSGTCLAAGCDVNGIVEGPGGERTAFQTTMDVVTVVGAVLPFLGEAGVGAEVASEVAQGPKATLELAEEILGNTPRGAQAITVLETAEGPTLVAGGEADLTAAQIARAEARGLTPVAEAGRHAEESAIIQAGDRGLTPTRGVTTINVCEGWCVPFIEELGGTVSGKYYWFPFK